MQTTQIARAVLAAFASLSAGAVFASGFQLLEQNASGLGNAYAGSAVVADNASTIYFNPAGMSRLKKVEVSGGGAYVMPSYKFTNEGSSNAPAYTGSNGGDAGDPALVPNAYGAFEFARGWHFGVGVGAPFGLKTEYDPDWVGRFHSLSFDIKTININPSVSWRVNDKVALGVGLSMQHMDAQYIRKAAVVNAFAQSTTLMLDAESDSYGWNAGMIFAPTENMELGLSYRSKVHHKLQGTLKSTNQLVSPDVLAEARLTLPDTWIFSVRQKLGNDWEMLGDVSRTGWSSVNTVPIVRMTGAQAGTTAQTLDAHFRNTWRVALGANQHLNERWSMKYGIAYDQSPVRGEAERLTSLPDNDRIWFSLGTQWKMTADTRVDLGAAYLYLRETKIDNNQSAQGRGRVTGTYDGRVIILGLQLSHAF